MSSAEIFHRVSYADEIASDMLRPTALKQSLRSGVFLSGMRRIGKTTFVRQDLVPAFKSHGALPLYVDLWSDRSKDPSDLVHEAVRRTLVELSMPGAGLLSHLKRIKGVDFGAAGFKFGFQLDTLGVKNGATLAQAFTELVKQLQVDVVLILDEVQQATVSENGINLLHALKAARDAVNTDPDMPGSFLFIGTGSHKSLVAEMATRRTQPFAGAAAVEFRPLGEDFVQWVLDRTRSSDTRVVTPDTRAAYEGFKRMGNRPEELSKALLQLQRAELSTTSPDAAFLIISDTLAAAAADVELAALDQFGELGAAIYDRIAQGQSSGLFSADALTSYGARTGSTVETRDVQVTADRMIAANLIMRQGHGVYVPSDPFIQQSWLARSRSTALVFGQTRSAPTAKGPHETPPPLD